MLMLLTQNHHLKTDAHSFPIPYTKLSSYQEANPKLQYHSLSQWTPPFFLLSNTFSQLHLSCDVFIVERSCSSGVFLKIYFFLQYPSQPGSNQEIKALHIIMYYPAWLKVTGNQILCVHIPLGNPRLWEQKYYYTLYNKLLKELDGIFIYISYTYIYFVCTDIHTPFWCRN